MIEPSNNPIKPTPSLNLQEEDSGTGSANTSPPQEVREWKGECDKRTVLDDLLGNTLSPMIHNGMKVSKKHKNNASITITDSGQGEKSINELKDSRENSSINPQEGEEEELMECVKCKWSGKLATPDPTNQKIVLNVGGKKFQTCK